MNNSENFPEWILLVSGIPTTTGSAALAKAEPGIVRAYQPESKSIREINSAFFGHELLAHPIHGYQAVSFLRWGNVGSVFDFESRKEVIRLQAPKDVRFFGHAVFSHDGSRLYCSAQSDSEKKGLILIYEYYNEMKLIGRIETGGCNPHQLILSDDEKTLTVINAHPSTRSVLNQNTGRGSSLMQIDLGTGQLQSLGNCSSIGYGHFAFDKKEKRYLLGGSSSVTNDTKALFSLVNQHVFNINLESKTSEIVGELLSLAISNKKESIAVLTVPQSNYLGIFDVAKGQFLDSIRTVSEPKGVAFSAAKENRFYVNTQNNEIVTIDFSIATESKIECRQVEKTENLGNCPHLNLTHFAA